MPDDAGKCFIMPLNLVNMYGMRLPPFRMNLNFVCMYLFSLISHIVCKESEKKHSKKRIRFISEMTVKNKLLSCAECLYVEKLKFTYLFQH